MIYFWIKQIAGRMLPLFCYYCGQRTHSKIDSALGALFGLKYTFCRYGKGFGLFTEESFFYKPNSLVGILFYSLTATLGNEISQKWLTFLNKGIVQPNICAITTLSPQILSNPQLGLVSLVLDPEYGPGDELSLRLVKVTQQ